jgi:hypothetical protein
LDFGDLLPKKTQPIGISEAFFDERSLKDGRSGEVRMRISIVSGYRPGDNENAETWRSMSGWISEIFYRKKRSLSG